MPSFCPDSFYPRKNGQGLQPIPASDPLAVKFVLDMRSDLDFGGVPEAAHFAGEVSGEKNFSMGLFNGPHQDLLNVVTIAPAPVMGDL